MASIDPRDPAPPCQVLGCSRHAQMLSHYNNVYLYMRTCVRHTYKHLEQAQVKKP